MTTRDMTTAPEPNPSDIQIRRIFLLEDAEAIQTLQRTAPEFARHYPRHFDWLKMAIQEIVDGKRFAFGVYKSAFTPAGDPATTLIGSIILKKETYSHVMQLKNLYMRREDRGKQYGRKLFEAVEQFCIKRGSTSIETEVPFDESGTVNFLNLMGFFVQNLVDSPYRKGDRIYRMYKPLPAKYTGDPFDLFRLSTWLFENNLGFRVVDSKVNGDSEGRFYYETTGTSDALQIRGLAYVWDSSSDLPGSKIQELQKEKGYPLIAVVARKVSAEALRRCKAHRLRVYDQVSLLKEMQSAFALDVPKFSREQVQGIIVRVNSKYREQVLRGSGKRTYFKGGPVGKYLKPGAKIFFFIEDSANAANGGLEGFATLQSCAVGPPHEIWRQHADKSPLFPENDFGAWSVDKAEVVALTFADVRAITAIGFPLLRQQVTCGNLDAESVGHFYLNAENVKSLSDSPPSKRQVIAEPSTSPSAKKGAIHLNETKLAVEFGDDSCTLTATHFALVAVLQKAETSWKALDVQKGVVEWLERHRSSGATLNVKATDKLRKLLEGLPKPDPADRTKTTYDTNPVSTLKDDAEKSLRAKADNDSETAKELLKVWPSKGTWTFKPAS